MTLDEKARKPRKHPLAPENPENKKAVPPQKRHPQQREPLGFAVAELLGGRPDGPLPAEIAGYRDIRGMRPHRLGRSAGRVRLVEKLGLSAADMSPVGRAGKRPTLQNPFEKRELLGCATSLQERGRPGAWTASKKKTPTMKKTRTGGDENKMKSIEEEYRKIGHQIRMMRTNRGMTQTELARRLGIAQASLCSMEHGKTPTTLRRLFQIRDIFACTMADFFETERPPAGDVSMEEVVQALQIVKKIRHMEAKEL